MTAPTLAELNSVPAPELVDRLAPLFEGAPRFLDRLAAARPFASWPELFDRARAIAHDLPEPAQVELVDAHPRLGAAPASLSAAARRDQGYDRPMPAGAATAIARLSRLNAAYEARFGFRYCVFVAGRPHEDLLSELEAALGRDRDAELRRALDAVVDIAAARLAALDADAPGRTGPR